MWVTVCGREPTAIITVSVRKLRRLWLRLLTPSTRMLAVIFLTTRGYRLAPVLYRSLPASCSGRLPAVLKSPAQPRNVLRGENVDGINHRLRLFLGHRSAMNRRIAQLKHLERELHLLCCNCTAIIKLANEPRPSILGVHIDVEAFGQIPGKNVE